MDNMVAGVVFDMTNVPDVLLPTWNAMNHVAVALTGNVPAMSY
jgi:hypothetical protein